MLARGNISEKAALERVLTEQRKRINRLNTSRVFFNSESKECKDIKH